VKPFLAALLGTAIVSLCAYSQVFTMTPEQLTKLTAQNPFDRFPDGRPKVPDAILERVKGMSAEETFSMFGRGFPNQFVGDMKIVRPGRKMVGRAFTVQFMPFRQDVADALAAERKAQGLGPLNHQTAIDMLQPGDVFVVDMYGDVSIGGIIGDNLAYYIWKKTGNGFVVDGPIRDLDGISEFDMGGYFRFATPNSIHNVMVTGINVPIRIGQTMVMPGDVVLGDREGVTFIPPHLVKGLADAADVTHVHDVWTKRKFDEGKYKSSEIYGRPRDPALIQEYEEYLKKELGETGWAEYQAEQKRRPAGPRPAAPAK
jgi:4-hydroxy-4-methyl-2-oxoglutarate aldolase